MKKFLAIIPARIGSKGLPKKNLHELDGKPLIFYTIKASLQSSFIKTTTISTDSNEIIEIAKKNNVNYIKRSKNLSSDSARTEDVIRDAIEKIEFIKEYEYLILLQPTSPLRTSLHINEACNKFLSSEADALISVKEQNKIVLKVFFENEEGFLTPGFNEEFPFMPRQELPQAFKPNGAIYICKIDSFKKNNSLFQKKTTFFLMDDISSIDIDTYDDILDVEEILKS